MRKLIVVTGGTKGIGLAVIKEFASHGFDIVTCSRHEDELIRLKKDVETMFTSTSVFVFQADLSRREEITSFVEFVVSLSRPVDVLVNNAGYFIPGSIYNEPEGNLESMLQANTLSAYHVSRGIIPLMIKARSGHIVNICSIASFMAYPNGGSYAISKFALLGFSKCLREELKEFGIRVTAVMPGATLTASWAGTSLPEDRFMPPEDVAALIYTTYSLSPRSVVEDIIIRPQLGDL